MAYVSNFDDLVRQRDLAQIETTLKGQIEADADRKLFVDIQYRAICTKTLAETPVPIQRLKDLADFAISVTKAGLSSTSLPAMILSDIFDAVSIEHAEEIFSVVEANSSVWNSKEFFTSTKNVLLRICNDLLRRLSRSLHMVFCGRILVFLARTLPLTEKSGLNLTSQFNTDNVTVFDETQEEEAVKIKESVREEGTEIEEGEMDDSDKQMDTTDGDVTDKTEDGKVPLDFNLYKRFWSLQRYFMNPILLHQTEGWEEFSKNSKYVLSAFQSYKLNDYNDEGQCSTDIESVDKQSKSAGDAKAGTEGSSSASRKRSADQESAIPGAAEGTVVSRKRRKTKELTDFEALGSSFLVGTPDWGQDAASLYAALKVHTAKREPYFAKYLTNQKLLQLQLSDSNFRRYVLTQYLIIFQFLTVESKIKEKLSPLSSEQREWVSCMRRFVTELLKQTPPDGEKYCETVEHILEREEHWNQWKNGNCEDFTLRAGTDKLMPLFRRRNKPRFNEKVIDLARPELTALWKNPDNFEACAGNNRIFTPKVSEFFDGLFESEEKVQELVNDQNWTWRALRLLSTESPHFFSPNSAHQIKHIKDFMELMKTRLGKDFPEKVAHLKMESNEEVNGDDMETTANGESSKEEVKSEIVTVDDDDNATEDDTLMEASGPVTAAHIKPLSGMIEADWAKLRDHLVAQEDDEKGPYHKFQPDDDTQKSPQHQCGALLGLWMTVEGDLASVANLTKLLKACGIFNEDIANVLSLYNTKDSTPGLRSGPQSVGTNVDSAANSPRPEEPSVLTPPVVDDKEDLEEVAIEKDEAELKIAEEETAQTSTEESTKLTTANDKDELSKEESVEPTGIENATQSTKLTIANKDEPPKEETVQTSTETEYATNSTKLTTAKDKTEPPNKESVETTGSENATVVSTELTTANDKTEPPNKESVETTGSENATESTELTTANDKTEPPNKESVETTGSENATESTELTTANDKTEPPNKESVETNGSENATVSTELTTANDKTEPPNKESVETTGSENATVGTELTTANDKAEPPNKESVETTGSENATESTELTTANDKTEPPNKESVETTGNENATVECTELTTANDKNEPPKEKSVETTGSENANEESIKLTTAYDKDEPPKDETTATGNTKLSPEIVDG